MKIQTSFIMRNFFSAFCFLILAMSQSFAQQWTLAAKLGSSDLQANDRFGEVLATSETHALLGAPGEVSSSSVSPSGAAYFFARQPDGSWLETQKIISPRAQALGYFGSAVAMKGPFALVGAYNESEGAVLGKGFVYAFVLDSSGQWILTDSIEAPDGRGGDNFGENIAMTEDFALIGAVHHDYDELGQDSLSDAGAVYLFQRQAAGQWTFVSKLLSPERAEGHQFGSEVTISPEGLAAFSPFIRNPVTFEPNAGAAYGVFCPGGCDFTTIQSSDLSLVGHAKGGSSMLLQDGWLALGRPEEKVPPGGGIFTEPSMGAVYFFRWENNQWTEKQAVYANDWERFAEYGSAVAIKNGVCAVGAAGKNVGNSPRVGVVYVLELTPSGQWQEAAKLLPTEGFFLDRVGTSLGFSGQELWVGAGNADTLNGQFRNDAGAAYVFRRDAALSLGKAQLNPWCRINSANNGNELLITHQAGMLANVKLQVYQLNGTIALQHKGPLPGSFSLNLQGLSPGIYLLTLEAPGKAPVHHRWVLQP